MLELPQSKEQGIPFGNAREKKNSWGWVIIILEPNISGDEAGKVCENLGSWKLAHSEAERFSGGNLSDVECR